MMDRVDYRRSGGNNILRLEKATRFSGIRSEGIAIGD
jgi:hypothetical protein